MSKQSSPMLSCKDEIWCSGCTREVAYAMKKPWPRPGEGAECPFCGHMGPYELQFTELGDGTMRLSGRIFPKGFQLLDLKANRCDARKVRKK